MSVGMSANRALIAALQFLPRVVSWKRDRPDRPMVGKAVAPYSQFVSAADESCSRKTLVVASKEHSLLEPPPR